MTQSNIQLRISNLAEQITVACLLEASARKPGNVHPEAAFNDLTYDDFKQAATITGDELHNVVQSGVGQSVLNAVKQTQQTLGTNVNLGIILLLAPLVVIPVETKLADGIKDSLTAIDLHQTKLIYQAIQIANPGGLGKVKQEDVAATPEIPIVAAMQLAAERDFIARQYSNGFADVLNFGRDQFLKWNGRLQDWEQSIIGTQLEFMAAFPDSLIARKCGKEVAFESSQRAKFVLEQNWLESSTGRKTIQEFDDWLRADGHRRNPGTTADIIAAVLFSLIRDEMWIPPTSISVAN